MKVRVGFRGRVAAAAAVVSLVTLGVGFALVAALVNRSQQHQLDEALSRVAIEEATELAEARDGALRISDRPGPAANDVGPLPKLGVLYDGAGKVISSEGNLHGQAAPPLHRLPRRDHESFNLWFAGEHLRGVVVPVGGHPGFRLLIAAPRTDLDGDAAFLTRAMLAVFAMAVALTVAMAIGIVGRFTRHHRVIAQTAKKVAGGDLSARVGSLGTSGDVAELGHNIDEMIERLALLLMGQQQFIAHAAHELRSPIAILYGELSHALRRSRGEGEYRAAISEALDSTKKLRTLAEDLLSLARLGAEHGAAIETVDVRRLLEEAIASASVDRSKIVNVQVVCPADTTVRGRSGDLVRMLRNLLENAIRHAPPGTTVGVTARPVDGTIEVEIRDEGPGIAPDERQRIFDPFFRGAAVRAANHPGAGLGLTIARDIARLHGGEITLASVDTLPGTRFIVRLPMKGAPPAELSTDSSPPVARGHGGAR